MEDPLLRQFPVGYAQHGLTLHRDGLHLAIWNIDYLARGCDAKDGSITADDSKKGGWNAIRTRKADVVEPHADRGAW